MYLIVGLGNPGKEYAKHRHNIGFMVVDEIARRASISLSQKKFASEFGDGRIGADRCILQKPSTFMNLSGNAVGPLAKFYDLQADHVIVVHDELDLPFGAIKLKQRGGHGGHNGLRSILPQIGEEMIRLRFGVGRPRGGDAADFVLSAFSKMEENELENLIGRAADAIEAVVSKGPTLAMNEVNRVPDTL